MITGDHPATALAIARSLGMVDANAQAMTGPELARIEIGALPERVHRVQVYARVDPAQKIRIVEALQARGECVAMTGDGVNDAPALRRADIGVSMGRGGTDVAREASDLVLLDDNFATIVAAVREGRRIYDNIRKFVRFVMAGNAGEIWTIFLAPFLGLPIPLTPIQILWVNFVTDGLPGPGTGRRTRRAQRDAPSATTAQRVDLCARGLAAHPVGRPADRRRQSVCLSLGACPRRPRTDDDIHGADLCTARARDGDPLRAREPVCHRRREQPPVAAAVAVSVALHLTLIYVPALQKVFGTEALSSHAFAVACGLAALVFVGVEIEKWAIRRGWLYQVQSAAPA